ncbi:MAG TPA: BadF/BadG/BcrA/BcrD ATPase family protein [Candidatus Acidoferrum sp.]|nr:BadF/BadG/BcrA/BcrD ATPase family protein [Candidatus Acidoferrum sp.]
MLRPRGARPGPAGKTDDDPRGGAIQTSVLGLDIGGSLSRAQLSAGGRVIAEVEGPGANVAALPPATVKRRLTALLAELGPIHPDACCAGAAGAEVPAGRLRLERLLVSLLPGCRISVVHDARLVLSAARVDEGIALISGTGSVAYGRTAGGLEARAGGWGWQLGDDGSGAWIAREAARDVMRSADAGKALGELGNRLLAAVNARDTSELLGRLNANREPRAWAAMAKIVFETADKDARAHSIVLRAASALAELATSVRRSIGIDGPVVLAGGLLLNQRELECAVREELGSSCIRLDEPPVAGAVRLAALALNT